MILPIQGSNESAFGPILPKSSATASVQIVPSSLNLKVGESGSVQVRFVPPKGLDASRFPVYSGYINITGGSKIVQVPYIGKYSQKRI